MAKFLLETCINFDIELMSFPPTQFRHEVRNYTLLGYSNKRDLIDEDSSDSKYEEDLLGGKIKQCIYSSDSGDLIDACVRKLNEREGIVLAIRSREMPPKPKKGKKDEKER